MRTFTGPLLLVLLFTSFLFAGQSCPVDVVKAERYVDAGQRPCFVHCGHTIDVAYKNLSGKAVVELALGVDMYADAKTTRPLFFDLRDRDSLEAGEMRQVSWSEVIYHRDYPLVNVFLKKVVFADGTEWRDDGSGSCNSGVAGLVSKGAPRDIPAPGNPSMAKALDQLADD
ncbi:MAG TPA: hypothetical protein VN577_03040 [Terriglobales bacterium]|nr:hypothetical protein [Terriglobales bacterium]